jgi:hypothetical protein
MSNHSSAQRHAWVISLLGTLSRDKTRFEEDADLQFKIHKIFAYIWLVNIVAALCVFFLAPGIWASASVLYLVIVSLYANFATDYGAVSAALAARGNISKE